MSLIAASRRSCGAPGTAAFRSPRCIVIAGATRFGARVSERLALAEQAVWELLHAGAIALDGDGAGPQPGAAEWQRVLLDWDAWSGAHAVRVTAPPAG